MAIKFQYNQTSLQVLEKQLKVRKRTLPIIKSKESALRMEVKKCKDDLVRLERELEELLQRAKEGRRSCYCEIDAKRETDGDGSCT